MLSLVSVIFCAIHKRNIIYFLLTSVQSDVEMERKISEVVLWRATADFINEKTFLLDIKIFPFLCFAFVFSLVARICWQESDAENLRRIEHYISVRQFPYVPFTDISESSEKEIGVLFNRRRKKKNRIIEIWDNEKPVIGSNLLIHWWLILDLGRIERMWGPSAHYHQHLIRPNDNCLISWFLFESCATFCFFLFFFWHDTINDM